MILRSTVAAAAVVATMNLTGNAFAGADNYVFEPVKSEIKSSNVATVAVRLVHKPTGKPVTDAESSRRASTCRPTAWPTWLRQSFRCPARTRRVRLQAPLTMTGRWLLTISAKVQGEPETVLGKLTFTVTR